MSAEAKVKKIIMDQLGVSADEVKPEASFVEDLGADSLDLTELIMAMEEEFSLEIDDEEAQKLLKVKDAVAYVERHAKWFPAFPRVPPRFRRLRVIATARLFRHVRFTAGGFFQGKPSIRYDRPGLLNACPVSNHSA